MNTRDRVFLHFNAGQSMGAWTLRVGRVRIIFGGQQAWYIFQGCLWHLPGITFIAGTMPDGVEDESSVGLHGVRWGISGDTICRAAKILTSAVCWLVKFGSGCF